MHPIVQDYFDMAFGHVVGIQCELGKLESAPRVVDAVSGDRGGAGKGKGAWTGVNMSVAPVPVLTLGRELCDGVGAGTVEESARATQPAGLASEYSPFNRGSDKIAAAVYSAVHDICFEECKRLGGSTLRGGGIGHPYFYSPTAPLVFRPNFAKTAFPRRRY